MDRAGDSLSTVQAWLFATGLLAADELGRLVRSSRGILFVVSIGLAAVGSALALDALLSRFAEETGMEIDPGVASSEGLADVLIRQRLASYADGRPLVAAVLHRELSIPGATLAWIYGFMVPWLVVIAGHARICEDRRTGYARFLFLRIHRSAFVAGKLAALWFFAAGATWLALAAHALWWNAWGAATLDELPVLGARVAVFCFPYAALALLASALVRSTVAALTLAAGALVVFGFAATVTDAWAGSPWARLWFGQWTSELWAGRSAPMAVFAASGLSFFGVAVWLSKARDA